MQTVKTDQTGQMPRLILVLSGLKALIVIGLVMHRLIDYKVFMFFAGLKGM